MLSRFGAIGGAKTDEKIVAAAPDAIVTIWHPTSTVRMSPSDAWWDVVDLQLHVKGVSGLRIVDASVFVRSSLLSLLVPLTVNVSGPACHTCWAYCWPRLYPCRTRGRHHQGCMAVRLHFAFPISRGLPSAAIHQSTVATLERPSCMLRAPRRDWLVQ